MAARFGLPLSKRELWVLELLALDGLTYPEIATRTGSTLYGAEMTGARIRTKLGARTTVQAVHMAIMQGIIGMYPNCGTRGGVGRHERSGTELCPKCRAFWRPYRAEVKRRARERQLT